MPLSASVEDNKLSSTPSAVWLDGAAPAINIGTTWGVPWPMGSIPKDTALALRDASGKSIPVQSWATAWWPDGSIKWTAHAIPAGIAVDNNLAITPGTPTAPEKSLKVRETTDVFEVDTGVIRCAIAKSGDVLVQRITRDGKPVLTNGRLIALSSSAPDLDGVAGTQQIDTFQSKIDTVTVEQNGPVRAVVKIKGRHTGKERAWLPFTLRLYFYAGGEAVRMMHSFVFDGDAEKDFIRGLGMRFDVPMTDLMHDRHVRFAGEGRGLWAEAVRGLTGIRRDPDAKNEANPVKNAQIDGRACPPVETFNQQVSERLQYIPAWGDVTLAQLSANGFTIRKRTKAGHGWIDADQGHRASGVGYIGGATGGGVIFGLRDFWQRHPSQLDIRNAHTDAAEVTIWLYSPGAPAMDLRFYHDGMGQDTFEKQYKGGLEITYEDYEPGFGDAHGIARTSEIYLWAVGATPARETFADMAALVREPARLVCSPARILAANVFGNVWSLPDRSTPAKAAIEDRLEWQIEYYKKQIDQRHWYGFWNYGDVMHSYDRDRHVWKYDIGGNAWDNSELSTDLWLWYYYLRTGRADVFRFAEAMTRHTSEVDTYHTGRFAGLGSRHNVQHWGCSAKQVRISTASYRRIYYFLTADERIGDILRELLDVDQKLNDVDPARKLGDASPLGGYDARVSFGIDWANLAAAWLTEWERGGDMKYRDKLLRGMRDWGKMPLGFFTSDRYGYKVADGSIEPLTLRGKLSADGKPVSVSHLDAVFGAVEIFSELIQLTASQHEYEGFKKAWLQYCTLYSASKSERVAALGTDFRNGSLTQAHSRLLAYAAKMNGDAKLAARAWKNFNLADYPGYAGDWAEVSLKTKRIEGTAVLNPIDEATWVGTNLSAQWGLSAIQCLALVGDKMAE
ncbi:Tat pathway signal sequence domain protein [Termitidicoccus mucosus]|uniref:Tat pathway signal sequence domain protein n=1 Tax=Termitidicoccus mucosus TaxID=1184151 RepID=A0A178IN02_9BACT|nr:Tat pathway signal sequence domain protein [Opitutaceae bacterium TSB47]